jgi:hypothetical protein
VTPLQKIAMGMVIVLVPASFPPHPHPAWQLYDALPDPVGWALVLAGVWALARSPEVGFDLDWVKMLGVLAFLVSVPLWFPQVNHLLAPEYNDHASVSFQWFVSLPQTLFGFFLVRAIGKEAATRVPRDRFVAGRFGVLAWGFVAAAVLPVVAFGAGVPGLVASSLLLIGLVDVVFVYYLFRVHRRSWLGGPGPLEIHPEPRTGSTGDTGSRKAAPDEPERPS